MEVSPLVQTLLKQANKQSHLSFPEPTTLKYLGKSLTKSAQCLTIPTQEPAKGGFIKYSLKDLVKQKERKWKNTTGEQLRMQMLVNGLSGSLNLP